MQLDKDFEKILTDFFTKYDKRQLRHNKPHKIAVTFKGRENEVMEHLCKKFDVDPKTIAGMDLSSPSQLPDSDREVESASAQETPIRKATGQASTASAGEAKGEGSEEKVEEKVEEGAEETGASPDEALPAGRQGSAEPDEKPKSKKKLVIIIVIVILLAAAGAAGYFFKDKILGETTASEQETPQENIEEVTPVKDEVEKTEEPPEAATDEQASEEEDETEEVSDEEGNDEEGNDEETSGEEE